MVEAKSYKAAGREVRVGCRRSRKRGQRILEERVVVDDSRKLIEGDGESTIPRSIYERLVRLSGAVKVIEVKQPSWGSRLGELSKRGALARVAKLDLLLKCKAKEGLRRGLSSCPKLLGKLVGLMLGDGISRSQVISCFARASSGYTTR